MPWTSPKHGEFFPVQTEQIKAYKGGLMVYFAKTSVPPYDCLYCEATQVESRHAL